MERELEKEDLSQSGAIYVVVTVVVVEALGHTGVDVESTMKVMQYCFDGIFVLRGQVIN
jgi:hypothetical protein